jgi:hypothetical protein
MMAATKIQIFVKESPDKPPITLDFDPNDTIENVKSIIQEELGVAPETYFPIVTGRLLENGRTLGDYNIQHGATIHIIRRMSGTMMQPTSSQSGISDVPFPEQAPVSPTAPQVDSPSSEDSYRTS